MPHHPHDDTDTILGVQPKVLLDALIVLHEAGHQIAPLQEEQDAVDGPLTKRFMEQVILPMLELTPKAAFVAIVLAILDDWVIETGGEFNPCAYMTEIEDELRDHITSNN